MIGILAALRHAERTGEGQSVDVSMTDGALIWTAMEAAAALQGARPRRGDTLLTGRHLCYLPYRCADGWIALGALEPKFWRAFCEGVGREDLVARQYDPPGSTAHAQVEAIVLERTRGEWDAFGETHDACLEPVWELEEALEGDLVREREMVVGIEQPGAAVPVRVLGLPVKLSATPGDVHRLPAPGLGEHTEEVLRRAGLDDGHIAALLASGAAGGPVG